jgi:hypothetical protein
VPVALAPDAAAVMGKVPAVPKEEAALLARVVSSAWRLLPSPPRFRPFGIQLVTFADGRFFIGITEVQLGVISLRLDDLRAFHELSRLSTMW